MLAVNLAAECQFLEIVETGGTLDIGQRLRHSFLVPLEDLTARQRPFELPDEFLEVMLDHSVQIDEFTVDIVQNLNFRRLFQKKQRCATRERFDIAGVLRKFRQDDIGQPALPTHPRYQSHCDGLLCVSYMTDTLCHARRRAGEPSV